MAIDDMSNDDTSNKVSLRARILLRLGSTDQKVKLLSKPSTPEADRVAFKDDPNSWVRAVAVMGAKSDATRLAFKGDINEYVRCDAVRGAKSDATRLAFLDDTYSDDAYFVVRIAAVSEMKSIANLQLALRRENQPAVRLVIRERMKAVEGKQGQQKSLA